MHMHTYSHTHTHTHSYLSRHDDQLEEIVGLQLEKTHHTSSHYRQQHANKEDTLRHVIMKERELFEGAGFGKQWLVQVHVTFSGPNVSYSEAFGPKILFSYCSNTS